METKAIIDCLIKSRKEIINRLQKVVDTNTSFNYRTFGTSIEDDLYDVIVGVLKDNNLLESDKEYKRAKDKNEFPDLTIFSTPKLALEAKSGNHSKLVNGVWKPCKNSANDLGTINMWEKKLQMFNGEDIYFVFVEYNFNDTQKLIVDVKIDHFYKFIGLNKAGLLSYREKDGNLRPKDFNEKSQVDSLGKFLDLLPETRAYRSGRIAYKHLKDLNKADIDKVLTKLFGSES